MIKEEAAVVEATVPSVETDRTALWAAFCTWKMSAALAEGYWVKVAPVMERLPVAVSVPLSLVAPKTPRVVEGEAVPMPTLFSLALTMKTLVSATIESEKVEVAVVMDSSVVPPEDRSRVSAPELKSPVFRSEEKVKAGKLAEPAGSRRVVPTARVSVVVAEPRSVVVALRLAILPLVVTMRASWAAEKVELPVKVLAEVPLWV